jgi:hypothetical protein
MFIVRTIGEPNSLRSCDLEMLTVGHSGTYFSSDKTGNINRHLRESCPL